MHMGVLPPCGAYSLPCVPVVQPHLTEGGSHSFIHLPIHSFILFTLPSSRLSFCVSSPWGKAQVGTAGKWAALTVTFQTHNISK